jgi:hypothetical protein
MGGGGALFTIIVHLVIALCNCGSANYSTYRYNNYSICTVHTIFAEPHHFYTAPTPGKNLDAARAAPAPIHMQ